MEKFSLWTGKIYNTFRETGFEADKHFNSEEYLNKIQIRAKRYDNKYDASNILGLITSIIRMSNNTKDLRIIDFGGGLGSALINIKEQVEKAKFKIYYELIDNKKITELGLERINTNTIYNKSLRNTEITSSRELGYLANKKDEIRIINLGSVLQYIEDQENVLEELVLAYKPMYMIFDDLYISKSKSFITTQHFFDLHEIPFKITSRKEFEAMIEKCKHFIIYESDKTPRYKGEEIFYDTTNLPSECKLERSKIVVTILKD